MSHRAKLASLIAEVVKTSAPAFLAFGCSIFVASNAAQGQESGWQNNRHFRPAPAAHSGSQTYSANQATQATRRQGWNLQWRTSPQVADQQARQISDAAFDGTANTANVAAPQETAVIPQRPSQPQVQLGQPQAQQVQAQAGQTVQRAFRQSNQLRETTQAPVLRRPRNLDPAAYNAAALNTSNRNTADPNTANLNAVEQVVWMAQNTATQNPGGMSVPDNLFRDSTAVPQTSPGSSFNLPGSSGSPQIEQIPAPQSVPQDLSDLFEIDPPSSTTRPGETLPSPVQPTPSQSGADGSIRDLMEQTPPPSQQAAPPEPMDSLESPSDREAFAPNPFGEPSDRDAQEAEQREQDRIRRQAEREQRRAQLKEDRPSIFSDDDEGPANSGTGLSCDDFRNRIEASTIDQVSLDISPPFRPDVIDEAEYMKLKGKFSEKQESRVWRSIDGRQLGTGRLSDLAYEKAVITTEFGTHEELPLNRLSEPDLAYISQNWGLPTECLIEQVAYTPRSWTPTTMTWTASNLCHKPMYFEEVNLERYGHTAGPFAQPIISSAHFFFNIAVLPYKMGVHSPHECQYALGYYRPGNCAPWIIPPVPLSVKGAWYQAAAITGTALLVP
ncbi:hypothetical protein SAMN06265222_10449 [Neorhodopirellula lusitana]|uniref:Uncharacterized protein n=1 Tax=Neorhodopirellula lusitana TaxID=445327 RepID=A0ABY1PYE4_9BACT|nr:hypothetical protein [Neorhodopirellula lusitana]SMP53074.1 hypothetical protein SAMN06265222_10449 [Neorhodopirellula lusitana]